MRCSSMGSGLAWLLMTAADAISGLSTRWMSAGTVPSPLGLGCSDEKEDSLGMTSMGTLAFPAAASQVHCLTSIIDAFSDMEGN